jgi:predicted transcriptional regulator
MAKTTDTTILFDPTKKGLERTLGPLEAAIMRFVWSSDKSVTVDQVQEHLVGSYGRKKYTTIASTMNRLCDKKILEREDRSGLSYYYHAVEKKKDYEMRVVRSVLESLVHEDFDNLAEAIAEVDEDVIVHLLKKTIAREDI